MSRKILGLHGLSSKITASTLRQWQNKGYKIGRALGEARVNIRGHHSPFMSIYFRLTLFA